MKATLVLLPLLGITYMLFFVNPGEDDLSQIVFIYFNSCLQSLQVGRVARWGCSALSWSAQVPAPQTGLAHMWFTCVYTHIEVRAHPVTSAPDWVWVTLLAPLAGLAPTCFEDAWRLSPQWTLVSFYHGGGAHPALSPWGPGAVFPAILSLRHPSRQSAPPCRPLTDPSFLSRVSSCLSSTAS